MRAALLAALVLAAAPAGAVAQGSSPFQGLPPAQTTPTVTVAPPDPGEGGLEGWQETLIFVAGGLLLVGIGWAIVGDARRRAPVRPGEEAHPGMGGATPNRSAEARARARAKAKAARRQRKRNR